MMSEKNKPGLRSGITTRGLTRSPHRAFLRGMGLGDDDFEKPFIGVVTTAGETTPCNMNLSQQAQAAKAGIIDAGGVSIILKVLLDGGYLHGDSLTIEGTSLSEQLRCAGEPDGQVVRSLADPLSTAGGLMVLKGNLCPDGALLKVAGLKSLFFEGPALVFESEEECMKVISQQTSIVGSVIVIRNEGPRGGQACAKC